ncbi:MFS transporter [Nonomuraea soli]|uniref:MFS family permease n=1 Tax=Nonomuraea soli TaxID=1032476 RepID=A0A7W0CN86_9ACTN|nr:MFS transporter [Nonomuraea soli]MBA2894313.1 MFS family permease [Nonomuraea soli]
MTRRFLLLWLGNTAGTFSMVLFPVLLAIAVLDAGADAAVLGAALAAKTAGFLLGTPVGGVLADRRAPGRTLGVAGLIAAAGTAGVAWLLEGQLWAVVAAALVAGVGQGLYRPAFQAAVAAAVAEEARQRANALSSMSGRIVSMAAPGLAATISVVAGARAVLAVSGALWLLTALGSGLLRRTATQPTATPAMTAAPAASSRGRVAFFRRASEEGSGAARRERSGARGAASFWEGVREARRHRWFFPGLVALAIQAAAGFSATQVLLPTISRSGFGGDALLASALTATTVGALAGALLMMRWKPPAPGWTALLGLSAYGLAPLSLVLPPSVPTVIAAYAVAGFGSSLFNITWFTATQREVPPHLLARVSAVDFLVSYGLAPLGLLAVSPLTELAGAPAVLLGCGLLCLLSPLAVMLVPTTRGFTGPARYDTTSLWRNRRKDSAMSSAA